MNENFETVKSILNTLHMDRKISTTAKHKYVCTTFQVLMFNGIKVICNTNLANMCQFV